jgi:hypothetical protein
MWLALLEPGVLEPLERRKYERQRSNAILLGDAMPVLNNSGKRTQCVGACAGSRLTRECASESTTTAHGARVLPDLHRRIKKRYDHTDCSDQLRDGVDCFQVHNDALLNHAQP